MSNTKSLKVSVLSALAIFGIAFPTTVAYVNRPAVAPEAAPQNLTLHAPTGAVEIGPVVIVEQTESTYTPVKVAPRQARPRTPGLVSAPIVKRIELEQQGRPGARSVLAWGI